MTSNKIKQKLKQLNLKPQTKGNDKKNLRNKEVTVEVKKVNS